MKKILGILGALGLTATSSLSVISFTNAPSLSSKMNDEKIDLRTSYNDLGWFVASDNDTLKDAIKTSFIWKNSNLNIDNDDIEVISDLSDNTAIVHASKNTKKVTGYTTVSFNLSETKLDLANSKTGLGSILYKNLKYNTILENFIKVNHELNLNKKDLELTSIESNTAIIKATTDSKIVMGEVRVYFELVDSRFNIKETFTKLEGFFNIDDEDIELQLINEYIKTNWFIFEGIEVHYSHFEILNLTRNSAVIKAKAFAPTITGQTTLTFNLDL